jgi:hypothetical protein
VISASTIILVATATALVGGPLLLGLTGLVRSLRSPSPGGAGAGQTWRLSLASAFLYALAFNLIFFVQELTLAGSKALVPGLHTTLTHNNHHWTGGAPVAALLQGTGALAILLLGLGCAAWLAWRPPGRAVMRLFLLWLAFHGAFMALPQVVVGAMLPQNDVGMAMNYLELGDGAKVAYALLALAAMVIIAIWLTGPLLALAPSRSAIDSPGKRTSFVFVAGTLPALVGSALIIPFRLPGPIVEVAIVPLVVMIAGLGWPQAGAWRFYGIAAGGMAPAETARAPLFWLVTLFVFFELVLRPGIALS